MILVITRMNVLSEKRMELMQAISSLSGLIRMEKGCNRCDFWESVESEDQFILLEEWDTEEKLMAHMKSEYFKVLLGAMNLLRAPYERIFNSVFHPAGLSEI
jgi:quinol monooxygenase YgiN